MTKSKAAPAKPAPSEAGSAPTGSITNPTGSERRYGGLTADERRADRRQRLMETGLELFGRDGYAYTGIEQLCSQAGVTARHFYDEFGSRENLLTAIFVDIVDHTIADVANAMSAQQDEPVPTIKRGMDAFLHSMLDDPRRARVMCVEVIGVSPELEKERRRAMHRFAELIADASRDLGLSPWNDDRGRAAGALALVGGANELLIEFITDTSETGTTFEQLSRDLVNFFIAVAKAEDVFAGE